MTSLTIGMAITELASVGDLCIAQIDAGLDSAEVHEDMHTVWHSNIGSLKFASQADKHGMIASIKAYGGWPKDHVVSLVKAVMKLPQTFTIGGADAANHESTLTIVGASPLARRINGKKDTRTQTDLNFQNKLTTKDWEVARSATRPDVVWGVLSLRAWMIGLCNPSEPTLYHMCQLVAHCMSDINANQSKTSNTMAKIKHAIKTRGVRSDVGYLEEYPKSARDLPRGMIAVAYGTPPDMPVDVEIPELHTILGETKMRKQSYGDDGSWMSQIPKKLQHQMPLALQRACTMSRLATTPFTPGGAAASGRDVYGAPPHTTENTSDVWRRGSNNVWERERPALGDGAGTEKPPARPEIDVRSDCARLEQGHSRTLPKTTTGGASDDLDAMERAMLGIDTKKTKPNKKVVSADETDDDDADAESEHKDDTDEDHSEDSDSHATKKRALKATKASGKHVKNEKIVKKKHVKNKKGSHERSVSKGGSAKKDRTKKGKNAGRDVHDKKKSHKDRTDKRDNTKDGKIDKTEKRKADTVDVTGVDISDMITKVKSARKSITRNCAHSRIYKACIGRAESAGFSTVSAKRWASLSCSQFLDRHTFKKG
jgi:hypothetical protein